jgi:hypothetical protein
MHGYSISGLYNTELSPITSKELAGASQRLRAGFEPADSGDKSL